MNILIVTESHYPDFIGGTSKVIHNLVRDLMRRGHRFHVITRKLSRQLPSYEVVDGVHVHRYGAFEQGTPLNFFNPVFSVVNAFRKFGELASQERFDVIYAHYPFPALGVYLHPKSASIRKVYTFHAPISKELVLDYKGRFPFWLLAGFIAIASRVERYVLARSHAITTLSDFMRQQIEEIHGLNDARISIVPGGVDTELFCPCVSKGQVRERLGLPQDRTILLTVRRLARRYGLQELLEAMVEVVRAHPRVLLLIGGRGYLEAELREDIQRKGLGDHVRLVGFIEDEVLPLFYQAADLFVLPTQELEGFGLVTLEALASGLPVVGTPVGGTVEILSRFSPQLLTRGRDSQALAERILHYLDAPAELAALGERARPFAEANYTWALAGRRIEQILAG